MSDNAKAKAAPRRTYSAYSRHQQQQLDTKNVSRWSSIVRTNSWGAPGEASERAVQQRMPPRPRTSREIYDEASSILGGEGVDDDRPPSERGAVARGASPIKVGWDRFSVDAELASGARNPERRSPGASKVSSSDSFPAKPPPDAPPPSRQRTTPPPSSDGRNPPVMKPRRARSIEGNSQFGNLSCEALEPISPPSLLSPSSPAAALFGDSAGAASRRGPQDRLVLPTRRPSTSVLLSPKSTGPSVVATGEGVDPHPMTARATTTTSTANAPAKASTTRNRRSREGRHPPSPHSPASAANRDRPVPPLSEMVDWIMDRDVPVGGSGSTMSVPPSHLSRSSHSLSAHSGSRSKSSTMMLSPPKRRESVEEEDGVWGAATAAAAAQAAAAASEGDSDGEEAVREEGPAAPPSKAAAAAAPPGKKKSKPRRPKTSSTARSKGGRAALLRAVEVRTPTPPPSPGRTENDDQDDRSRESP